jgi:hypothetical protein
MRLTRAGIDAWLDKEKLVPGSDWDLEIRKAVRETDVVVVCLSKQFNQAGYRQKEVRIALDEADNSPKVRFLLFLPPGECDTLEFRAGTGWIYLKTMAMKDWRCWSSGQKKLTLCRSKRAGSSILINSVLQEIDTAIAAI